MTDARTHKAQTHARIIDEAADAMRLYGSGGISVAKLMQRAGLTHGGFYAHFASRDDLVTDAVGRMFEDSRSMIETTLGAMEGRAGIAALIDAYLSDAVRRAPERGCPLPGLAGEAPRMPDAARACFDRGVEDFRNALAGAFRTLGNPEPLSLATSVLAEMVGAMALARASADNAAGAKILESSRRLLKTRLGLD